MTHSLERKVLEDFRVFLWLAWKHLNLPAPTPIQQDIAQFLSSGPDRMILQAFRGVGKSWITSAFVCWSLLRNPQLNILYQFQKLLMHLEIWRLSPGSSSRALVRGRGDPGL